MSRVFELSSGRRPSLREMLPGLCLSLGLFLVVGWFNGRRNMFLADRDEGYSLIKALLVERGHPLYSETWSDQPPGHTWLLVAWRALLGDAPELVRLSTTLLLAAFGFGCFELCRRSVRGVAGYVGGVACIAGLLLQAEMFRYGCAVMISLPAMLCVALGWVVSAHSSSVRAALGTGVLIGWGLAIKPLGAPAVPGIFIGLCWAAFLRTRSVKRTLGVVGVAIGSCLATGALLYWPVFVRAGGEVVYQTNSLKSVGWPGWWALLGFLRDDAWLLVAAVMGWGALAVRRRGEALALGSWLVLGAIMLALYAPVWSHHRYLILLPAVPLFGLGLAVLWEGATWHGARGRVALGAALVMWVSAGLLFPGQRWGEIGRAFSHRPKPEPVMQLLSQVSGATSMVTSNHMYAYRLGLDVPPFLAVTSRKRFERWQLSSKELTATSLAFDPDIVVLDDRWPRRALNEIREGLSASHVPIYEKGRLFVLVRQRLLAGSTLGTSSWRKTKPSFKKSAAGLPP